MKIQHTFLDYPDNSSGAIIVYMSGCEHNCDDCQSPDLQEFTDKENIVEVVSEIVHMQDKWKTNKLVISGGDCLHPKNLKYTKDIINTFKCFYDDEICIYTGYDLDYIKKLNLKRFDYIKGGKYEVTLKQESKKTDEYIQFASTNQFLIDNNYNILSKNGVYTFPTN